MSAASQHTPGPWRVAPVSDYQDAAVNVDAGPRGYVCQTGFRDDPEAVENAHFIVRACNAHDELLAALQSIQSLAGVYGERSGLARRIGEICAAAIAKAEGRS